jgi:hypothetical protein
LEAKISSCSLYPSIGNQSIIIGGISLGYLLAEAALIDPPSTLDDLYNSRIKILGGHPSDAFR